MPDEIWQLEVVTSRAIHPLKFPTRRGALSVYRRIQKTRMESEPREFNNGFGGLIWIRPGDVLEMNVNRRLEDENVQLLRHQQLETLRLEAEEIRLKTHADNFWKGDSHDGN